MTPLFFLHGFLGSPLDWTEIVQFLSPHFPCYLLELPWQDKLSFDETVLHLKNQINRKKVFQGIFIGYSLGGRLGLKLANLFPELFSHCIFLSTHPGIEEEALRQKRKKKDQAWIDIVLQKGMDHFLEKWYEQPLFSRLKIDQDLLLRRKKWSKEEIVWVLQQWSIAHQDSMWKQLASLQPTLFLFGKEDLQYHAVFHKIFNLGNSLQTEWIEDATHAIHIEQPRSCADAIASFINRTESVDLL